MSTVRYSLHGGGTTSGQTRERVRQVADEMGYVPNLLARDLRQNRSGQVGVVVPMLKRNWYSELIETLDTALYEEGYQLLLSCSHYQHERQFRCLDSFVGHQMDGLIALPLHHTEPQSLQRAQAAGIPVILVDRPVAGVEADLVETDDEEGGYLAASHLLHCGRQRLAYVGPVQKMVEAEYSVSRARGTDRALAEAGIWWVSNRRTGVEVPGGQEHARPVMAEAVPAPLQAVRMRAALWLGEARRRHESACSRERRLSRW